MMRALGICWALVLAVLVAAGDTYYVDGSDPGASDSGPGTEGNPWKTLAHAAARVGPGDTVLIRAGLYREWVSPRKSARRFPRPQPLFGTPPSRLEASGPWRPSPSGTAGATSIPPPRCSTKRTRTDQPAGQDDNDCSLRRTCRPPPQKCGTTPSPATEPILSGVRNSCRKAGRSRKEGRAARNGSHSDTLPPGRVGQPIFEMW